MIFGEKLKQLRQQRNWNQPELADAIGIEQSYLSKLENDKSVPSPEVLNRILEAFGIQLDTLLEDIDDADVRNNLRAIPQIANYLQLQQASSRTHRSRWIIGTSLCVALGLSTLIAGDAALLFPDQAYNYVSLEIVPNGANGETFATIEAYVNYRYAPTEAQLVVSEPNYDEIENEKRALALNYANLATAEYFLSYAYLGNIYNTDLESSNDQRILASVGSNSGGSRTFHLNGTITNTRFENQALKYLGVLLLMLGVFGVIADLRLHWKQRTP